MAAVSGAFAELPLELNKTIVEHLLGVPASKVDEASLDWRVTGQRTESWQATMRQLNNFARTSKGFAQTVDEMGGRFWYNLLVKLFSAVFVRDLFDGDSLLSCQLSLLVKSKDGPYPDIADINKLDRARFCCLGRLIRQIIDGKVSIPGSPRLAEYTRDDRAHWKKLRGRSERMFKHPSSIVLYAAEAEFVRLATLRPTHSGKAPYARKKRQALLLVGAQFQASQLDPALAAKVEVMRPAQTPKEHQRLASRYKVVSIHWTALADAEQMVHLLAFDWRDVILLFGISAALANMWRQPDLLSDGHRQMLLLFLKSHTQPNGPYILFPSWAHALYPLELLSPANWGFYPSSQEQQIGRFLVPSLFRIEQLLAKRHDVLGHLVFIVTACLSLEIILF